MISTPQCPVQPASTPHVDGDRYALGWTENRSVRKMARKWVVAALEDIEKSMPFPLLGIDRSGWECINAHLLAWCAERKLTFTRSRAGNSNDGAHVEQKNGPSCAPWLVTTATTREQNWCCSTRSGSCESLLTNYFQPQQAHQQGPRLREGHQEVRRRDHTASPRRWPLTSPGRVLEHQCAAHASVRSPSPVATSLTLPPAQMTHALTSPAELNRQWCSKRSR